MNTGKFTVWVQERTEVEFFLIQLAIVVTALLLLQFAFKTEVLRDFELFGDGEEDEGGAPVPATPAASPSNVQRVTVPGDDKPGDDESDSDSE